MAATNSVLVRRLVLVLCAMALCALLPAIAAQTCETTSDPLTATPPDYTDAAFAHCVEVRCKATLGITVTSTTDGYCNGDATSEATVPCGTLLNAYKSFYSCVLATTLQFKQGDAALIAELSQYRWTPGYPLHLTAIPCYACNNFRDTVAPALGADFTCAWSCKDVMPAGTSRIRPSEPGQGYNHVLCGIGCMTCLLMGMAFTILSAFIFLCCGCCWPTPSLKSTAAVAAEEEEKEKAAERKRNGVESSDDDEEEEDVAADDNEEPNAAQDDQQEEAAPAHQEPAQTRDVNDRHAGDDESDEEL